MNINKMKAAILVEQNQPLVIDDVTLPEELKYGQVLVKIYYTTICGSQLGEIDGVKGPDKYLPHLLGHEGSGVVEKCGEGITTVKPGDHVVLHWREGKGIQSPTPHYKWKEKLVNAGSITTFNEYALVSENRLTPIDKAFDMKIASLYCCAITTGFGVINNNAHLKSGESIIVFGAGGVGAAIILAASCASAYPIIAIDINDFKLDQARKFGATHTINSMKLSPNQNIQEKIREILPQGVDVIVETTGIKAVRELAYELTNNTGRTIMVGVPKNGEKMNLDTLPLHFTKKITGSHGGKANPTYDIPRLIRLQQNGAFDLTEMITKEFSLDQINEAIQLVRKGDVIRCVIKMA